MTTGGRHHRDHCLTSILRCSDGAQGGAPSGNTGSSSPLAGGKQPASDSGRDGVVAGDGAQVPLLSQGQALAAATAEEITQDVPAPREEQLSRLAGISRAGPRQVETPVEDSLSPWSDQSCQWLTGDRLKVVRFRSCWMQGEPVRFRVRQPLSDNQQRQRQETRVAAVRGQRSHHRGP